MGVGVLMDQSVLAGRDELDGVRGAGADDRGRVPAVDGLVERCVPWWTVDRDPSPPFWRTMCSADSRMRARPSVT